MCWELSAPAETSRISNEGTAVRVGFSIHSTQFKETQMAGLPIDTGDVQASPASPQRVLAPPDAPFSPD